MCTIKAKNLISVRFLILFNITTTCHIIVKKGYLLGSILQRWIVILPLCLISHPNKTCSIKSS